MLSSLFQPLQYKEATVEYLLQVLNASEHQSCFHLYPSRLRPWSTKLGHKDQWHPNLNINKVKQLVTNYIASKMDVAEKKC